MRRKSVLRTQTLRAASAGALIRRAWTAFLAAFAVCSCVPVTSNMQRKETLALAIKVTDKDTNQPLEGAVVHVKGGRNFPITSGATRPDGEYSFLHTFYNRSGGTAYVPDLTIIEIWKEGYKRVQVILKTTDYLHGKSQSSLFKELDVPLTRGRGSERLNLLQNEDQSAR